MSDRHKKLHKVNKQYHNVQTQRLRVWKIRQEMEEAQERQREIIRQKELDEERQSQVVKVDVFAQIGEQKMRNDLEDLIQRRRRKRSEAVWTVCATTSKAAAFCLLLAGAAYLMWPHVNPPRSPWRQLAPEATEFADVHEYLSQLFRSWRYTYSDTASTAAKDARTTPELALDDEIPRDQLAKVDWAIVSLQVNQENMNYVAVCDFGDMGRYALQVGKETNHFKFQEISFY